ncbi:hypothetical protein BJV85_002072 [Clostridium acetobutylicum]|uniref:Uncharacterized protein n=1 Tax=Clostridium acetobutylicum (strain ATCC 824 / DSM 792 / JCM 1419 / IAM 19013 / LMG 5710 / NBRC 13948 / NRRL B-527 / VKM B-1787 / 2291 / W) TaxID=272562 RepID=Q97HT6_CLOAB|nr:MULTISPECIES: hypothetical protein [Clostridium]AAK79884.1 Hypothetical protein CA_C1921 [Clostridium acetobutylicum ATCC 824]ADZ20973.1 Conserved hypothetical protein [Clostridium acetobutylicum EA 2018]AEI32060.1 hypothetical protein SMB_G1949 [Clostridium acetobutylicum DSM 1731]AWV79685.1 hypothetical protein DK921_06140 [Clostridium acetobutylicum]MBC2394339.1 hypothetical protein [Clostridium acetobutylicum]
MKKLNKTEETAINVYSALANLFCDEEEQEPVQKIDIASIEGNELFTAILLAHKMLFEKLTITNEDAISFTHILNRLAVQYVIGDRDCYDKEINK